MTQEAAFIAALRALAGTPAARDLNDDAAIIEFGGEALVLTHDAMAETVHWIAGQDMADVAWKLAASNLSDLAAKGAEPIGVLLGYTLAHDVADARFLAGLTEALGHYRCPLLGGDTIACTGPQTLGLTAIGRATHRPVPSRAGAMAGDAIYLTGPVGAAMLGFEALRDGTAADTLAFRRPAALLAKGQALAPLVTAMMDVSDGLLLDASRMARASGATFAIDSAAVPVAVPEDRRAEALRWGDDYQLLFTAPPGTALPVHAHRIGTVGDDETGALELDGRILRDHEPLGYRHGHSSV